MGSLQGRRSGGRGLWGSNHLWVSVGGGSVGCPSLGRRLPPRPSAVCLVHRRRGASRLSCCRLHSEDQQRVSLDLAPGKHVWVTGAPVSSSCAG